MVERVAAAIGDLPFAFEDPAGEPVVLRLHPNSVARIAKQAIAAHKAALAEAGYVIVPREPTEAMCQAGKVRCHGVDVGDGSGRTICGQHFAVTPADYWKWMLDAALKD